MFKCSTPGTIMRIWRFQCFRFNRLHTFVAIAMYRARSTCVRHFCVSVYQRRMCSIIKFIVNRNRIVVVFLQFFFRVSLQHFISFICIRKIQLRVKKSSLLCMKQYKNGLIVFCCWWWPDTDNEIANSREYSGSLRIYESMNQ